MKKLFISFSLILFMCLQVALAQTREITGTVTGADDGVAIPGASVIVRGTTIGTMTDAEGNYSLDVPENAQILMFTFIGMKTVEEAIGDRSVIDVVLETDVLGLEEVIVTGLGITRTKKALGYSVQDISGDDLVIAREQNLVNSLQGRLSGVQITNSSGGVSSGSRIVIRGMSTLSGNNQPLFVVDGVPIINSYSSLGAWGGVDYGNSAMDLNPSDIESMTILKGANAAALYGSQAINGVVLITTKTGKGRPGAREGLGVTYESNWMFDNPLKLPEFQNKYGQGSGGEFEYVDGDGAGTYDWVDESWGPPLDTGLMIAQFDSPYDPVTGVRTPTPWVSHPDNVKNVFETGISATNTLTFHGAGDKANFRLSLGNQSIKGMIPNTDLTKNTITLAAGMNVTDKFKVSGSANYINNSSDNIMGGGYSGENIFQSLSQWFGRQVDTEDLKEKWEDIDPVTGTPYNWNHSYHNNPYFILNKNLNSRDRNRIIGNLNLEYTFNEWLKLTATTGNDFYAQDIKEVRAKGTNDYPEGRFSAWQSTRNQLTARSQLQFNKGFGDFDVLAAVGGEYSRYNYLSHATHVSELIIPDLYSVSNAAVAATTGLSETHHELQSAFGTVNLGFRNFLFLDLTGRNDWSSTLPVDNNSYFYPSVSLGFVITEALGFSSDIFSYAKLRASYAEVGGTADAYDLQGTYDASNPFNGQPRLTLGNTQPPLGLLPQRKKSIEFGAELKFLNNKIRADGTYYKENTTNQIMNIEIAPSSGFTSRTINAGNIQNEGFELTLGATPVETSKFRWDINVNWSTNKNTVIELTEGMRSLYLFRGSWHMNVYAYPGEEYGQMIGGGSVKEFVEPVYYEGTDEVAYTKYSGRPVVNTSGNHIITPERTLVGNVQPDWFGGVSNGFSYEDFNFSFMVDFRKGGDQYSVTHWFGGYAGVMDETAVNNPKGNNVRDDVADGGGVLIEDAVYGYVKTDGTIQYTDADGNDVATAVKNTTYVDAYSYFGNYWGNTEISTFDASFVKLREVVLGYTFHDVVPWLSNINVSLVGRNLWLIHSNMPHVDPENAFSAGNNNLGMNSNPIPSARSFGFNVKFSF